MWKILVVDDIAMNSELLVETLADLAQCEVCGNGTGALAAFNQSIEQKAPYDLILLDIAMPDMSGIEVLKKIRDDEEKRGIRLGHGIPIIVVTAYKESFMDAFNSGCDDYVLKPVDTDKLLVKIQEKLTADI
jgi:CheY-like chemotaxis protein